jgi:hypothetical protein
VEKTEIITKEKMRKTQGEQTRKKRGKRRARGWEPFLLPWKTIGGGGRTLLGGSKPYSFLERR